MSASSPVVLNVDDNEVGRYASTRALRAAGFNVREAKTGAEALAIARRERPDLILLDVLLPDESGWDLCRKMKEDPLTASIPVLQFSGVFTDAEHKLRGFSSGADAYLTGMLEPAVLAATVQAMIRSHSVRAGGLLANAAEHAPAPIAIMRANGEYCFANRSWQELIGSKPDLAGLFHKRDRETLAARVISRSEETDGARIFETTRFPLFEDGEVVAVASVSVERGPALRAGRERLQAVLESIDLGIWYCDLPFDKLVWNDRCRAHFGVAPDGEVTIDLFYSLVHPADREEVRQAIESAISSHTGIDIEFRTAAPDGRARWIRAIGRAFYDAAGRPVRFDGVTVDVTDRKRIEQNMFTRQKMESIGLLAAGIAHDFNNLLTTIMGNASFMQDMLPPDHACRSMNDDIISAGQRAAALAAQLLAYAGKGQFLLSPTDLSGMVANTAALLEAGLPKMVRLHLDLDPALPMIEGDVNQLRQVVTNLVTNAGEAIGANPGTIHIRTGIAHIDSVAALDYVPDGCIGPGRHVFLEVEDTGDGFDEDTRLQLFDPFFTTKFMGRGLGLSAVLGIVRGHKGGLLVRSEPGRGSTFRICFPALEAPARDARKLPGATVQDRGLILVVDDEETVLRMAQKALEYQGYHVLVAADGVEAVDVFSQMHDRISLVVLDYSMPQMGGREVLRRMRRINPQVPVILSSGYSGGQARELFGPAEKADFLQKPYTHVELIAKVNEML